MFSSIDPHSGQTVQVHSGQTDAEVLQRVSDSQRAFKAWRSLSPKFRVRKLRDLREALESAEGDLARLMQSEMGKPLAEGVAEVQKSRKLCDWVLEHAEEALAPEALQAPQGKAELHLRPLGPILGIMPWNFPVWQVLRFALPTMAAGNTVLIKPAENVIKTTLFLDELMERSGFAGGVYQTLIVTRDQTEKLVEHPLIRGVSLTGSVRAGKRVGELCGKHLKKCVLELGGSDPYIVLKDADLQMASSEIIRGRFLNAGQSCVSAKRILVVREVYDQLKAKLWEQLPSVQIGPMARMDLVEQLKDQVARSLQAGAKRTYQGPVQEQAFFHPVTVLEDVRPGMPAFDEELFGPVLVLCQVRDMEEAVEWANQSEYGLGAAIFSKASDFATQVMRDQVDAGIVFVNGQVKSDPSMPFGGVKSSGLGRELGILGFREFVNYKTVVVM